MKTIIIHIEEGKAVDVKIDSLLTGLELRTVLRSVKYQHSIDRRENLRIIKMRKVKEDVGRTYE